MVVGYSCLTSTALPPLPLRQKPLLVEPKLDHYVDGKKNIVPMIALELPRRTDQSHPQIPPFLPQLPEKRSYQATPLLVEEGTDPKKARSKRLEESVKVEKSLNALHRVRRSQKRSLLEEFDQ
eukprot:g43479.t1